MFVTVGTDHHPFDRLVRWSDDWAADHPWTEVVIQFGTAAPPRNARAYPALRHDHVLALMRRATAVVTQGGPAGIVDCRGCGRLPIVVPRTAELGECVDDHQVAFVHHLARIGRIAQADDHATLVTLLDRAIAQPEEFTVPALDAPTASTAHRVDEYLQHLLRRPPPTRFGWLSALRTRKSHRTNHP